MCVQDVCVFIYKIYTAVQERGGENPHLACFLCPLRVVSCRLSLSLGKGDGCIIREPYARGLRVPQRGGGVRATGQPQTYHHTLHITQQVATSPRRHASTTQYISVFNNARFGKGYSTVLKVGKMLIFFCWPKLSVLSLLKSNHQGIKARRSFCVCTL